MTEAYKFMDQFDDDGRYSAEEGTLSVVFLSRDQQFPGKVHFLDGLRERATMEGGSDWGYPNNAPLKEVHFLLLFADAPPNGILVDDGRVVQHYDKGNPR